MISKENIFPGSCKTPIMFVFICVFVGISILYYSRYEKSVRATNIWIARIRNPPDRRVIHSNASVKDNSYSFRETLNDWYVEDDDLFGPTNFDINGSDVMVFLHMQKTGGTTLGHHLVRNMILPKQCDPIENRKRSNCLRPNSDTETWIFSRYTTGWSCGLHADWTELHECVAEKMNKIEQTKKDRKFFYITILRDPVKRYLSEWKHVQRGATWKATSFSCQGKPNDIPHCYKGETWKDVSLKEFMACPYNMAANRQTRMLADLRLIRCYDRWLNSHLNTTEIKELEDTMLESAMTNLKEMSFFGLLEEQVKLQELFEHTFPFKFKTAFEQLNVTFASESAPSERDLKTIKKLNRLDIKLYEYAKKLFLQRSKLLSKR